MLKKLNNKTTKGLLALAILLGGSLSAYSAVNADTTTAGARTNPFTNVVTAIATKFGLNQTDVQAVVDAEMQKQRQEMEAKFAESFATRLAEAVIAGKLTQTQADLITAKQAEVKIKMESIHAQESTLSETDEHAQMKAVMDEVKAWATANNIPKEYLMFGGGRGGHKGGPGHFGGMGKVTQ